MNNNELELLKRKLRKEDKSKKNAITQSLIRKIQNQRKEIADLLDRNKQLTLEIGMMKHRESWDNQPGPFSHWNE